MPRLVPKILSSREACYMRCRRSHSPTVNTYNMPVGESSARPNLGGSSRRPAHTQSRTATHTHTHAHTHTHTHTHTNTHATTKRAHERTHASTHTNPDKRSARTRTRTRTRTSAHPRARTPRPHKRTPTRPHTEPPGRSTATAATASVFPDELGSSNPGKHILCARRLAPLPGTARARRPK